MLGIIVSVLVGVCNAAECNAAITHIWVLLLTGIAQTAQMKNCPSLRSPAVNENRMKYFPSGDYCF